MKSHQFFSLTSLTYLPLILMGALVNTNSASAAGLSTGYIDLTFDSIVYFQNNLVDFTNEPGQSNIFGDPANPGVGTPAPDFGTAFQARGGFEVTEATGSLLDAGFLGAKGAATDQYVPPALLAVTGGLAISDFKYVVSDFGLGIDSVRYLDIDRDGNGLVDATYDYTTFTRKETVNADGSITIDIVLDGFFDYVNDGGTALSFDRTYSSMALLSFSSPIPGIDLAVIPTPADFVGSNPYSSVPSSTIAVPEPLTLGGAALASLLGWRFKKGAAKTKSK